MTILALIKPQVGIKKRGFPRLLSGPPRKEESYSVRIVSAHELLCV